MRIHSMAGAISAALASALIAQASYADKPSGAGLEAKRVVRDKDSGELRAPTPAELQQLLAVEKAERKAKGEPEPAADPQPMEIRQHEGSMKSAVLGQDYLITIQAKRDKDRKLVTSHSNPAYDHAAADDRPTE